MKVTNYRPGGLPTVLGGWSSGVLAVNSNFNTIDGGLSATNFVQLITANSSNALLRPVVNFAAGSNILLTLDAGPGGSVPSNTIRIHSTGGGGGGTISAGSNSTRVSETSSAGASTTLWSPFDHIHDGIGTVTASSSNTMQRGTLNLRPGSGVAFGLTDTDGSGLFDTITISATSGGSGGGGGGGSSTDVIATMFGTPDTAYEFDSSSLSGLTVLGSPDAEDANTTIPGAYYVSDSGGTYAWVGRYATAPSAPFTAITKVVAALTMTTYNALALFVGVASPGNMDVIEVSRSVRGINGERVTPSAFSSEFYAFGNPPQNLNPPFYLAIRANSSTSFDYLVSLDGYVWRAVTAARNPGITIATVGIIIKSENASFSMQAGFDFLRIWNSAKTFVGA